MGALIQGWPRVLCAEKGQAGQRELLYRVCRKGGRCGLNMGMTPNCSERHVQAGARRVAGLIAVRRLAPAPPSGFRQGQVPEGLYYIQDGFVDLMLMPR